MAEQRMFHYDAFISYRHAETDTAAAVGLHRRLESFRMPAGLRTDLPEEKRRIQRVFRDQDELPLSSNLSDAIESALRNTDWLIVIATPRFPQSKWCAKEIERFTELYGQDHILVVLAGALYMIRGRITSADLVAYLLYVTTLLASIRRLVEFTEQYQRGITGIERFAEVMEEPVTIADLPGAKELTEVRGDVVFENVSFAYDDAAEGAPAVLSHINLHVKPGESVALVGPSGSGKTTLCNLIPRFYEVTGGRILLDGEDITRYTLSSLRRQIGTVQQDVYLFSGTVLRNIEYGRPGASREDIVRAAKLAGAHDFIMQLENGYETYCGEHGVMLSGGQKQRISIARVFLKSPPLLILDEATSALDNESERLVQRSLETLMKGRTTFTIAHRLTTIRNADTILVLTEDGIVEQGSHETLMAKKGKYYELYSLYQEN